ncbi:hypothetical protein [Planococcus shixiaomingii]|uniref:hypothetical protein n=1 Tax=Planococcus shixiaomingii TaxID=3058393 RepID=UPI0026132A80|nr:hypothetical protein [Planococcus sp. N022]WKA56546.1 hypothetical protein QWY21_09420 [Planococcus sp. N022]
MGFFKKIFVSYDPVFASSNLFCMMQLEDILKIKNCHCYIEMKSYPVFIMKCPSSDSMSAKQWIINEEFTCDKLEKDHIYY